MGDSLNLSGLLIENLNSLFDAEKKQGIALAKIKKLAKSNEMIQYICYQLDMKV